MAGFDTSALSDFSNETRPEILSKIVNEGTTVELATLQPGVKYKEPINLLDVQPEIQEGFGCVSTESGSNAFTQRDLEVCRRTAHDGFCFADVEKKYLAHQASAGSVYSETEAIMGDITKQLVNKFQKSTEVFLWNVGGTNGCSVDGLFQHVSSSTAGVTEVSQDALTTGNAVANVDEIYAAIPTDVMDREDLTIFMSVGNFKKYLIALQEKNYFNNGDVKSLAGGNMMTVEHPFAKNVKIVGTVGLGTSNRIVAGPSKDIVIGTDLAADATDFQLWYDINSDKVKYRLTAKFGANIAFPEYWISNDLA